MNLVHLALLMVFSCFTMNLVLQFGLGVRGFVSNNGCIKDLFIMPLIIFVTVLSLWVIFVKFISILSGSILIYILLFPVASISYNGVEYLVCRFFANKEKDNEKHLTFCNGITAVALFVCYSMANIFIEALIISLGIVLGILLSVLILCEIRKRALLESVPKFLQGVPLVIISMGLLLLVFTSAALMLFRIAG